MQLVLTKIKAVDCSESGPNCVSFTDGKVLYSHTIGKTHVGATVIRYDDPGGTPDVLGVDLVERTLRMVLFTDSLHGTRGVSHDFAYASVPQDVLEFLGLQVRLRRSVKT